MMFGTVFLYSFSSIVAVKKFGEFSTSSFIEEIEQQHVDISDDVDSSSATCTNEELPKAIVETKVCPICFDDVPIDQMITLDCGHCLCMREELDEAGSIQRPSCAYSYVSSLINQHLVGEENLVCCIPNCKCPLTTDQVWLSTVGSAERYPFDTLKEQRKKDFDKFLHCTARYYAGESGEVCVSCGRDTCESHLLMAQKLKDTLDSVTCLECGFEFCPKCGLPPHKEISCEEAKNLAERDEVESLATREKWQKCPECKTICERERGCNFMTCQNPTCRKKGVYFCYICGERVSREAHGKREHWPLGIFEPYCINKPGSSDSIRPPSIIPLNVPLHHNINIPRIDHNMFRRMRLERLRNQHGYFNLPHA